MTATALERVPLNPKLLASLQQRLGDRLSTSAAICAQHGKDESYHAPHAPDAVAFAQSTDEVAEIVVLCAESDGVRIIGLIESAEGPRVGRLPLLTDLAALPEIDAAIVTDQRAPQATYDRMVGILPRERVLAPRILNISRVPPKLAE